MAQRQRRGFSLLEIAIALTIIGLLTAGAAQMLTTLTVRKQRQTTEENLERVKQSLVEYFAATCSLPCPDDPTDSNSGRQIDCSDPNAVAVPWRDLGIPRSAAFDGWNRRIRYAPADKPDKLAVNATPPSGLPSDRVFKDITNVRDGAPCEGGGGSKNLTEFIKDDADNGLEVKDRNGNYFHEKGSRKAAAFILISPGPNGEADLDNSDGDETFIIGRSGTISGDAFDDMGTAMKIMTLARKAGISP